VGRGDTSGLAEKQVTLQPNTHMIEVLNSPKINKQPVSLVALILDGIGLVCIAQGPAAEIDPPCYLTGEEHRDYPRPSGYRNIRYWP